MRLLFKLLRELAPSHGESEDPFGTQSQRDAAATRVEQIVHEYAKALGDLLSVDARNTPYFHYMTLHIADQVIPFMTIHPDQVGVSRV